MKRLLERETAKVEWLSSRFDYVLKAYDVPKMNFKDWANKRVASLKSKVKKNQTRLRTNELLRFVNRLSRPTV